MTNTIAMYQAEVFLKLRELGDPHRVLSAKNDKKSQLDFLAIRVPLLRKAVQEGFSFYHLSSQDVLAIWDVIWRTSSYFEMKSIALLYYEIQRAHIEPEIWPCLKKWSDGIENWAHCDSLANIYSYFLSGQVEGVYEYLVYCNNTNQHWLRRLSLVSLIHYTGKKAVFLPPESVFPLVTNCLGDKNQYVQKAVGWVLRETGNVFPDQTRRYVEEHIEMMSHIALRTVGIPNSLSRR